MRSLPLFLRLIAVPGNLEGPATRSMKEELASCLHRGLLCADKHQSFLGGLHRPGTYISVQAPGQYAISKAGSFTCMSRPLPNCSCMQQFETLTAGSSRRLRLTPGSESVLVPSPGLASEGTRSQSLRFSCRQNKQTCILPYPRPTCT
jgi:hypothetical protein